MPWVRRVVNGRERLMFVSDVIPRPQPAPPVTPTRAPGIPVSPYRPAEPRTPTPRAIEPAVPRPLTPGGRVPFPTAAVPVTLTPTVRPAQPGTAAASVGVVPRPIPLPSGRGGIGPGPTPSPTRPAAPGIPVSPYRPPEPRTTTPVPSPVGGRGDVAYQTYGTQARAANRAAGGGAFLEVLDRLQATDPERAAEVARFTSSIEQNKSFIDNLGQTRQTPAAFDASVFFTERSYLDRGLLPGVATENVWNAIARRQGWDITGAEMLEQWGYRSRGGGVWVYGEDPFGVDFPLPGGVAGDGGEGDGGGGGGGGFSFNSPSVRAVSMGLVNWRI